MLRERTNAEGLNAETQRLIALPRCLWCGLGMHGESGRMHHLTNNCQVVVESIVIDFHQRPGKHYVARTARWCIRLQNELEEHYRKAAGL